MMHSCLKRKDGKLNHDTKTLHISYIQMKVCFSMNLMFEDNDLDESGNLRNKKWM